MSRRPCLDCPALAAPGKPRCRSCEAGRQRIRNASRPQYAGSWDRDAKSAIAAYRVAHGDVCPGWQRAPHPIVSTQWACDHDLGPLCIRCNGAKGGGYDRQRRTAERKAN